MAEAAGIEIDFKKADGPGHAIILVDLDENLKRDDWAIGILYCAMT